MPLADRTDLGPVLVTAVVSAALLTHAASSPVPAYAVSSAVGGVAAGIAAAVMLRSGAFEARLTALLVSSVSGLLAVLRLVLGAPGDPGTRVTPGAVLLVCAAAALPLLLLPRPQPARTRASGPYPRSP